MSPCVGILSFPPNRSAGLLRKTTTTRSQKKFLLISGPMLLFAHSGSVCENEHSNSSSSWTFPASVGWRVRDSTIAVSLYATKCTSTICEKILRDAKCTAANPKKAAKSHEDTASNQFFCCCSLTSRNPAISVPTNNNRLTAFFPRSLFWSKFRNWMP